MNLKKLLLLIIACLCFSWIYGQDCGTISIALEQYRASGVGTNYGIIKVTVIDSQINEGVITFQWKGTNGGTDSPREVTIATNETDDYGNNIYYISSLPKGNYEVTVNKYCILEWGGLPAASTDTKTITIEETSGGTEPL